jgi:hypothetical protein
MSRTQDHHRLEPRENAPAQRQRDFNRDSLETLRLRGGGCHDQRVFRKPEA